MGVGGQRHDLVTLPPGKTRCSLYSRLGGPPGPVWTGAKNLSPTEIPSTVRPASSELLYRLKYPGLQFLFGMGADFSLSRGCSFKYWRYLYVRREHY